MLANMAFDMNYIIQQFKCKGGASVRDSSERSMLSLLLRVLSVDYKLRVRIGIHSGRVIAGVVGLKVPRYHCTLPRLNLSFHLAALKLAVCPQCSAIPCRSRR